MEHEDFNQEFKDEIKRVGSSKEKPTLFLHACCGPCLTYPLSVLVRYFQVTVGYFNPNIAPEAEYLRRRKTREEFISCYSNDHHIQVPFVLEKEDFLKYDSLDRKSVV